VMSSACCGSIVELMESSVMSSSTWHSGMLIEFLDISKDEWKVKCMLPLKSLPASSWGSVQTSTHLQPSLC
jgi:hypothetical protein